MRLRAALTEAQAAPAPDHPTSEFTDSLADLFELRGPGTVRRMFGGSVVDHDGLMFAIVVDDVLYLKADTGAAAHPRSFGKIDSAPLLP